MSNQDVGREPDANAIIAKIEALKTGESLIYWRGKTAFMLGNRHERRWLAWIEQVNVEGWLEFTQRRVGVDKSPNGAQYDIGIFEYKAYRRRARSKPMRW